MMRTKYASAALAAGLALTLATTGLVAQQPQRKGRGMGPRVTKAVAVLMPTKGNDVHGTVTFTQTEQGLHVQGRITGLAPGEHGFHVHEFGDLSSDDGSAAGGHFNPGMHEHAGPTVPMRHSGDMGNITANEQGVAEIDATFDNMRLGGPGGILGHGLIVHEKADDLKSQPSGNAGSRVAQAVIGVAKDGVAKTQ